MPLLAPGLLVLLFVACVLYARGFKLEDTGFEQQGLPLLLYHLSRLGLVGFVTILCYSAGYRALELLRSSPARLFGSARKIFILCFFLGASLYGILFTILGLAGLISVQSGLACSVPILLVSHRPLQALAGVFIESEARLPSLDRAGKPFAWFVIVLGGAAALTFLVTRVVYIAVFDPNIWEHYTHYYRAVQASGSTQPNEIWHHFYASKGAGLILMTNVLSDFLGAQIVSASFALAAGVVVLDLLLEFCESASWAFFGVIVYFVFMYGGVADGATFKHHLVILGYVSFALWGVFILINASADQRRPLMVVMLVSFAYFGFYQPPMGVLLPAAFVLVALVGKVFRARSGALPLFVLSCGMIAGSGLALATNWLLTGLWEVTPMRWLWAIADQAKAERVFGMGGIEFFLKMNNDIRTNYDWTFGRIWKVFRYPLSTNLVYWGLLNLFVALVLVRARAGAADSLRFLAYLAAFVLPLGIFAQVVQTNAVDRLALYSIVPMTLASVVILKELVDVYVGSQTAPAPAVLAAAGEKRSGARVRIVPWQMATIAIILLGTSWAMVQAWKAIGKEQRKIIGEFVTGAISLKQSFHLVETKIFASEVGMSIAAMSEFRRRYPADGRILRLSYEGGFAYTFAGDGIVSEPTYSLIRNPGKILAASPQEVAHYLRERSISYFSVDLQERLFSTVAFSALFDVNQLPMYFSLAYEDGDFFVLRWREGADEPPPSDYLLAMLEFKRSGVLHYPFIDRFAARIGRPDNTLVTDMASFERVRSEFGENLATTFAEDMLPLVSMKPSKIFLGEILKAAQDAVAGAGPEIETSLSTAALRPLRKYLNASQGRSQAKVIKQVRTRDLQARFLAIARDAIYERYKVELGTEIASLLRYCDERVPFAIDDPADAACSI